MTRITCTAAFLATTALTALAAPAASQDVLVAPPPSHYTLDERGVDLIQGRFNHGSTELMIGRPGQGGLSYARTYIGSGWRDNLTGTVLEGGGAVTVSLGPISDLFTGSGTGPFTPREDTGATLSRSGDLYTYTAADGTVAIFSRAYPSYSGQASASARIVALRRPNGEEHTFHYNSATACKFPDAPPCVTVHRVQSVTSNLGYQLHLVYQNDDPGVFQYLNQYSKLLSVTGFNRTIDACEPLAFACVYSRNWPSATLTPTTVTDELGRTTTYTFATDGVTSIRAPQSVAPEVTIAYSGGRVSSVAAVGGTWTYAYATSGATRTTTTTNSLSETTTAVSDTSTNRLTSFADGEGGIIGYQYDTQGRLTRATLPEGNYTAYAYGARGNVTTVTNVAKPGSGLADIVTGAVYPSACANPVTCNQPTSTTDARGFTTDYTYDSAHGGVLTVTRPAPTTGAARPQTRYTYAAQTAWYRNDAGVIAAAPTSVTLPTQVSACATGASCAGGADEVRTTVAYGSAGVANNLLPTSVSQGSGAGPSMAVTALTWTSDGDVETVDGPLSGTDDTTRYRYDDGRELVGVIGPDPDGGGALLNRAQRYTYNPRGQITKVESGTTAGQGDGAWAAFSPLVSIEADYDSWGRLEMVEQPSGGVAPISQRQFSYDAAGRVLCDTVRMKMDSAVPTDACVAETPGSYGPDRITRATYDAAGRPLTITTAHGLPEAITESVTWTANGRPQTLTDGNGDVSTLVYDGFDRVSQLRYPNASGGGSSTTDREMYAYDAASNVTGFTSRGGQVFALTHDALNRLTYQDAPAGTDDVSAAYDNLDRATSLAYPGGQTVTTTWDALSRPTAETTSPLGTVASLYDEAGRRTRLIWPDATYVTYEYDLYDALTAVKTGAGATLAGYAYNDLGQRTGITRQNGVTTAYGYDAAARMNALTHDPAGTSQDVIFGYTYSPAGQIAGRTVSNPTYVYAPSTGTTAYANNGRNQVTSAGGGAVGYDASGNITALDGVTRGYDGRNQLTASGPASFQFDPAGRLYRSAGTADTRFLYDGVQAIAEYDASGTLTRRHVPGAMTDETVVTWDGAAGQWLLADERGSVIGLADGAGTTGVNAYDDYGVPAPGNAGRFQYTGQMWLPDAGLYHYKARAYAPQIGRFLQTDPIGYAAGANLYVYVAGDPVNLIDPSGLARQYICTSDYDWTTGTLINVVCQWVDVGPSCDFQCRTDYAHGWNRFFYQYPSGDRDRGNIYDRFPGGGTGRGSVFRDPQFAAYDEARRQAAQENAWLAIPALAPAAVPILAELGAAGALSATTRLGSRFVAVEGRSVGYQLYGQGRVFQVRFFTDRLIIRLDANKPITHINVQGRNFNFHFPRW